MVPTLSPSLSACLLSHCCACHTALPCRYTFSLCLVYARRRLSRIWCWVLSDYLTNMESSCLCFCLSIYTHFTDFFPLSFLPPRSVFDRQWRLRLHVKRYSSSNYRGWFFIEEETFLVLSFTFFQHCLLAFFTPLFAFLLLFSAVITPFYSSSFSPLISPECFLMPPSAVSVSPPFPLFFAIHPFISFCHSVHFPSFLTCFIITGSNIYILLICTCYLNSSPFFRNIVISFTSPLLPYFSPSSGHE